MDTKKNMSREQLLAYMRDNCTEAEAQQVRMWLRERLKDPGLDQLFSDLLDATETEYDPEGKERVRRKLDSILAACPAPNSPPRSGNLRRWRWSLRIFDPDSYANWIDNDNFFFVEQTLGDIVADLRRHFAVEIVVTDKSLCDETYYASFVNEESLDEILDALNKDRLFSVRREAEVYYISPPLK